MQGVPPSSRLIKQKCPPCVKPNMAEHSRPDMNHKSFLLESPLPRRQKSDVGVEDVQESCTKNSRRILT